MLEDGRIVPVVEPDDAVIELRASTLVFVERHRRARCSRCDKRRVLYRIAIRTILRSPEFTEALCATCWGIAPEAE
jgi:hypothetical protein